MFETPNVLCGICNYSASKYSCPKCNIAYCSQECYKSLSHINCSETFYHDEIQDYIKNTVPSEDIQKKSLEILKKNIAIENMEDFDFGKYTNLWDCLEIEEKTKFVEFVNTIKIGDKLPDQLFRPWWKINLKMYNSHNIFRIDDKKEREIKFKFPKLIPSILKITHIKRALLKYNEQIEKRLFSLICSYVFIYRSNTGIENNAYFFYNLMILCKFLHNSSSESYDSLDALSLFEQNLSRSHLLNDYIASEFQNSDISNFIIKEIYDDFLAILQSKYKNIPLIFYCLSDICQNLRKYCKENNDTIYTYKKAKFYIYWSKDNFEEFGKKMTLLISLKNSILKANSLPF
ncbi:hypothetical protein HZS_7304 [Henneguya salminicola]|nr:hypothetical protein HZS_7304 [Henneguya salminicola]